MKILGRNIGSLDKVTGTTRDRRDYINGKRFDNISRGIFNVLNYGADATGAADSRAAVRAAMDAAVAVGGGDVYFPTGTYKLAVTGYAVTTVYQRAAGTWGTALASNVSTEQTVTGTGKNVVFVDGVPTTEGSDGDVAIDYTGGQVYTKAGGTWSLSGDLVDREGTGWYAYHFNSGPEDTVGSDGDFWFDWVFTDTGIGSNRNYASIYLEPTDDNIRFLGDGYNNSQINFRCWSDQDPSAYEVFSINPANCKSSVSARDAVFLRSDTFWWATNDGTYTNAGEVISAVSRHANVAAFPGTGSNNTFYIDESTGDVYEWTGSAYAVTSDLLQIAGHRNTKIPQVATYSNGDFNRGNLFYMVRTAAYGEKADNVTWEGLRLYGGNTPTGSSSWYNNYDRLQHWDISNKAVHFGQDADAMNTVIKDCKMDSWRGEIIYKGGWGTHWITVQDSYFWDSNSSAISCGAHMTIERCDVRRVEAGVENYCVFAGDMTTPQFTVVRDSTFDLSDDGIGFEGQHGVVYIGDANGTYLTVTGCTFIQGSSGVFLSDFADDVTVSGNTFSDQQLGAIYQLYLNQYALPMHYDNITFSNNSVTAVTRDMVAMWLGYVGGGATAHYDWSITGNTTYATGANAVLVAINNNASTVNGTFEVTGNTFNETRFFSGSGQVPAYSGNTENSVNAERITNYVASAKSIFIADDDALIWDVNSTADGQDLVLTGLDRMPVGKSLTINGNNHQRGLYVRADAAWNTLSADYYIKGNAILVMQLDSNQKYELVSWTPET